MASPLSSQWQGKLAHLLSARNAWTQRLAAELTFAERLAELTPTSAPRWRKLLAKATKRVESVLAGGRIDRIAKAVVEAEEILKPIGRAAKKYTIHCVGHAHIDMNWMWSWPETVAVANDTVLSVLKLMDEFPDFCFTQSQASVYAILAEYCPELLEQVRARVAEGRWEVVAAHWVEGDKNLASGESLARHLLYARAYTEELFGLADDSQLVDWEPDTFGHARTIPGIVTRGGVKYYYLCRGGKFDKPPVFRWRGPDGSRVLVYNDERNWYLGPVETAHAVRMLDFAEKTGLKDWMNVYGVGDHGGGPTRQDLSRITEMDAWPIYPRWRFATSGAFFKLLDKRADALDELDCELNFEFTGCYTSQSQIKRANRHGENHCVEAELAAALASRATGRAYPHAALREAWIGTLFGQFHDILPGSCIREGRQYQMALFQRTATTAGMIKTHSLRALAAKIDTSFAAPAAVDTSPQMEASRAFGGGAGYGTMNGSLSGAGHVADGPRPFVVFNPTDAARCGMVKVNVWDAGDGPFRVRYCDGSVLPAQRVDGGAYWQHSFVQLAVPVQVGPIGYTALAIESGEAPQGHPGVVAVGLVEGDAGQPAQAPTMENDSILVEFDRATGGIARLVHKASGADLAGETEPLALLEYILERPRGMSAWTLGDAKDRCSPLAVESLGFAARGPHMAAFEVKHKINDSRVTVTYTLGAGEPWLGVELKVNWLERGTSETGVPQLALRLPTGLRDAHASYEVPFGSIAREQNHGEEVPALRWAHVTGKLAGGKKAGLALLNDCKYGHSLDGATLRLTLVHSTYEPDPLPEYGEQTIRLGLAPHGGSRGAAELIRLGARLNHPLQVVASDAHKGDLPAAMDGVSVAPGGVVLSSVRRAMNADALIFHLLETKGRDANAKVTLDAKLFGSPSDAVEVDFLERQVDESTAKVTSGGLVVKIPAMGIAAVKVTFDG